MTFRLTDESGQTQYWASPERTVEVKNGLFTTPLNPSAVDWQTVVPFIEVSVNGQVLQPRQPLTSSAYSLMSGGVVDHAITANKLSPEVQMALVPPGMIGLFAGVCPAGWARFSGLDNRFPMGAAQYGATGGSTMHTHTIAADGSHSHGGATGFMIEPGDGRGDSGAWVARYQHRHTISADGEHSHGGSTGSAEMLPPYLSVVYCQKS
jgi:hypothetical protein